jgi:hypothetical protein
LNGIDVQRVRLAGGHNEKAGPVHYQFAPADDPRNLSGENSLDGERTRIAFHMVPSALGLKYEVVVAKASTGREQVGHRPSLSHPD